MRNGLNIKGFARKEDGTVLVFLAVSIPTLLMILALSFDLGRRASTQTDMQGFADAVALAAAGELDGRPGAIDRANAAIANLVSDSVKGGAVDFSDVQLNVSETKFYSTLPAADNRSDFSAAGKYQLPADTTGNTIETDSDTAARLVGVKLTAIQPSWTFANMFGAGDAQDDALGATAIAGFKSYACDVAPVFVCKPNNWTNIDGAYNGQMLKLKAGGGKEPGGQDPKWGPGNFGFLDVTENIQDPDGACKDYNGSNLLTCLIAAYQPLSRCVDSSALVTDTGQSVGVTSAVFNTRFDMYSGSVKDFKDKALFYPGPHTVRGTKPKQANKDCVGEQQEASDYMPFPIDDCYEEAGGGGCSDVTDRIRFGDGDWTIGRLKYVDQNYNAGVGYNEGTDDWGTYMDGTVEYTYFVRDDGSRITADTDLASLDRFWHRDDPFREGVSVSGYDLSDSPNSGTAPVQKPLPTGDISRYQFYKNEISLATTGTTSDGMGGLKWDIGPIFGDADTPDNGSAQCTSGQISDPDRRTFVVAMVDCDAYPPKGKSTLRADEYIQVFMSQPFEDDLQINDDKFSLWGEVVGPVGGLGQGGSSTGIFREVVQLYK